MEYDKLCEIQEKLRGLLLQFRGSSKEEQERLEQVLKAKDLLNENSKNYDTFVGLTDDNLKRLDEFEALYKAMLDSEDYRSKNPIAEKKLRRIA